MKLPKGRFSCQIEMKLRGQTVSYNPFLTACSQPSTAQISSAFRLLTRTDREVKAEFSTIMTHIFQEQSKK